MGSQLNDNCSESLTAYEHKDLHNLTSLDVLLFLALSSLSQCLRLRTKVFKRSRLMVQSKRSNRRGSTNTLGQPLTRYHFSGCSTPCVGHLTHNCKAAINLNSFEGCHQLLIARLLIGYNVEEPDRRDRLIYLTSVGCVKKPAIISPSVNRSQLFPLRSNPTLVCARRGNNRY
jgi:hypothetical protein